VSAAEKNKYRKTLNLPTTSLSIRAHAQEKEPLLRAKWSENDIHTQYFAQNKQQTFVLHDGPPYANGHLHLGHALNKILKDIVVRSKRMSGYSVSFMPGWDCHGLPIELKVTAEQANLTDEGSAKAIAALDDKVLFKKLCRSYAQRWIDIQKEEFKALGVWAEWDKSYATMNPSYQADILRGLAQFVRKGYIERKWKTVPWCFSCRTVLAAAEIEYADRKDPSCYILFPVTNILHAALFSDIVPEVQIGALIWTTTPWTIPLNRAVVLHPTAEYVLLDLGNNQAGIVGKDLASHVCSELGIEKKILKTVNSKAFVGHMLKHPFTSIGTVPVLHDVSVGAEEGTACLHSAPGCGPEDYLFGVKNGLEIYSPLSADGRYTDAILPADLNGILITDGQWWVLKHLKKLGLLVHKTSIKHSYPHCWRCNNGLMFRATEQWFCNLEKRQLTQRSRHALEEITFVPAWGKNRLDAFIENRTEWCISRQRSWGVPIPALFCNETEQAYLTAESIEKIADQVAQKGIEYWDHVTIEELKEEGILPSELANKDVTTIRKETDILDVWFDSGVSHTAVIVAAEKSLPVDLYLEGSDQHRGWFQSSLLSSMVLYGKPQTRQILTHGFVVDKHGYKMSKSRGNAKAPFDIIKTHGADILRFWVASVDYERDVVMSDQVLANSAEVYRKIRNTCRFLLANLYDFNVERDGVTHDELRVLDRYALHEVLRINKEVQQLYAQYRFAQVANTISRYCANELSSFYLDIIKDRLYVEGAESHARRSAQTVLATIIAILNRLIAPILVHTAEDIYHAMPFKQETASIHLTRFCQDVVQEHDAWWHQLKGFRSEILKALEVQRAQDVIKHSLEARVVVHIDPVSPFGKYYRSFIAHLQKEGEGEHAFFKEWFIVSEYEHVPHSSGLEATALEGCYVHVEHADGKKCPRCWQWSTAQHADHLCDRCMALISNI